MRKKALTREQREIQVINWFSVRIQDGNEDYASMNQVAKGLGMVPASKLTKILLGMVKNGILSVAKLERSGRWTGRCYMLKSGTFQRPQKQTREIKLTCKGISQMEVFE